MIVFNNTAAWTELLMLPKVALCRPGKAGSQNERTAAAFTLDRLARWQAGERMSLWADVAARTQRSEPSTPASRQRLAEALARDGVR